jgi:3-hydroxyisobutyrate dehydrogenase-like beta-hydroxyacid dehydrogenase
MAIKTVGIMSPGDMGHSIGNTLRAGGLRVITCLSGRSARTAALASEAGIEDSADYETLVREADVVLSVLAPSEARALADRLAAAIRATDADVLVADCNAIAPQTVREIGETIVDAGGRFVDGGIIGSPPKPGEMRTRLYVSGEHAVEMMQLSEHGMNVRVVGPEIGQASGLKMCYAAITKGLTALATELLVAGQAMGLQAPLRKELQDSQGTLLSWVERQVPTMPPKAYRWVGEMEEIAATFEHLGLTPRILAGAADLYRFVEQTPLGNETPEVRQRGETLDEVVAILAEELPPSGVLAPR